MEYNSSDSSESEESLGEGDDGRRFAGGAEQVMEKLEH